MSILGRIFDYLVAITSAIAVVYFAWTGDFAKANFFTIFLVYVAVKGLEKRPIKVEHNLVRLVVDQKFMRDNQEVIIRFVLNELNLRGYRIYKRSEKKNA